MDFFQCLRFLGGGVIEGRLAVGLFRSLTTSGRGGSAVDGLGIEDTVLFGDSVDDTSSLSIPLSLSSSQNSAASESNLNEGRWSPKSRRTFCCWGPPKGKGGFWARR